MDRFPKKNWIQRVSDLSKPYKYFSSDSSGSFDTIFVTEHGIRYLIYLTDASGYFPAYPEFNFQIFMFGFKPDQVPTKNDPRVKDTILQFLAKYFKSKPNNALVFVCDTSDKRQDVRFKMFSNWYDENNKTSAEDSNIIKTDISFCDENNSNCAHATLLISKYNPELNKIMTAFQELDRNFRAKYNDE